MTAMDSTPEDPQVTHKGKPHRLSGVDLWPSLDHGGARRVDVAPLVPLYEEDQAQCKAERLSCDPLASIPVNSPSPRRGEPILATRSVTRPRTEGVLGKSDYTTGVMSSWQIDMTEYGCVLTVYVAGSSTEVKQGAGQPVMIALTDAQLRMICQDLQSAVDLFDLEAWGKPSLWQRVFRSRRT